MSDLSISQLGVLTNGQLAATDLEVSVDVSDLAMAPSGTDKRMTAQEKAWAYVRLSKAYRGLVTPSTAYNPGDYVQLLDGRIVEIIIPCTSSVSATIPSANYVLVVPQFYIIASGILYDSNPVSAAANTTALQGYLNAANPTAANAAGGKVLLSKGGFYTNAFIQIPNGVTLEGNSTFGTYWSLATGSNCSVVGPHISTGAGNANAFYWGLRDLSIDCRGTSQGILVTDVSMTASSTTITSTATPWVNGQRVLGSGILPDTTVSGAAGAGPYTATLSQAAQQTLSAATVMTGTAVACYGVYAETNPLVTQQSGDWGFDPSGMIFNVTVKNARDAGFANFGRSANKYIGCKSSSSMGYGFIGSFDSRYLSCESDFSAWHGFEFRGSSEQIANCKSYNSGQNKTTTAAANNQANGYRFAGFSGFGGIAISGCDAQQNTGNAFELVFCRSIAIAGCTATGIGFGSAVTTNVGFNLNNCTGCTVVGTVDVQPSNHCYSLNTGSTENTLILGFQGTSKGTAAQGSTDTGNCVVINGTSVNFPGLVSSVTVASALPKTYGRVAAGGMFYTPGVVNAGPAGVLDRAESVPMYPPRNGMTVKDLSIRVWTATATAIVRACVYTSDYTGSDTWALLGELPSTFDCSTTGIKTIAYASPLAIPDDKIVWITSVPQVAVATSYACAMGNNVATSNAWGNFALGTAGISGAFAATLVPGTTGIGTGISTVATLNN